MMSDYVIRGTAADGQVLAFACDTTEMVEETHRRHQTTNTATAAIGRTMSAAAMMAAGLKEEHESITINIEGDGPIGRVIAQATGAGCVRGYVDHPEVDLPLNKKGKLDVGGAIGLGVMSIEKDLGLKEPYIGSTHLVSSEIAEDLAYYFTVSEQIPSAVSLGVLANEDGSVWKSGGYIIQLLPGASEEIADELQKRVEAFPQLTHFLAEGHTPEEVLETLLEGMGYETLGKVDMRFQCFCNKHKVEGALVSIGKEDLDSLIADGKTIEMTCHFCNEKYYFTVPELKALRRWMDRQEE